MLSTRSRGLALLLAAACVLVLLTSSDAKDEEKPKKKKGDMTGYQKRVAAKYIAEMARKEGTWQPCLNAPCNSFR